METDGYDDMGDGYKGDTVLKWVGIFAFCLAVLFASILFIHGVIDSTI